MEQVSFKVLENIDSGLLRILKKLEIENLGTDAALNDWQIPVLIKYGKFAVAMNAEEEIIGVCQALRSWSCPDVAFIHSFYIVERCRRRGAGKKFLEFIIGLLRAEKFISVELTVDPRNLQALNLYKNSGFIIREFEKDQYGPGTDRYLMELKL